MSNSHMVNEIKNRSLTPSDRGRNDTKRKTPQKDG